MAARIASTAGAFTGLPAKAPSRSTRCSHSEALRLEICAPGRPGSSLNTVAARHVAELEAHALAAF
jgi:hypothetical protein